ncbi:hypothetical protein NPIL_204481 [Nephila pilipes]|uniref:Uncharacterized protein n=1 Tax=Nephila pilipes TaxID=299642 RepID=A0A8X6UKG7_NEPPI|nr:hypothetical protein NPIL_204481 [Nephila pilipes]
MLSREQSSGGDPKRWMLSRVAVQIKLFFDQRVIRDIINCSRSRLSKCEKLIDAPYHEINWKMGEVVDCIQSLDWTNLSCLTVDGGNNMSIIKKGLVGQVKQIRNE